MALRRLLAHGFTRQVLAVIIHNTIPSMAWVCAILGARDWTVNSVAAIGRQGTSPPPTRPLTRDARRYWAGDMRTVCRNWRVNALWSE